MRRWMLNGYMALIRSTSLTRSYVRISLRGICVLSVNEVAEAWKVPSEAAKWPLKPRNRIWHSHELNFQRPYQRVHGADLVVPVGADQQQVPHFRVRNQVFKEVERCCIQPLRSRECVSAL
jgi:hypothetical protein